MGDDKHKKICWKAWTDLCEPKKSGGLGFQNLESFNQALLSSPSKVLVDPNTSITGTQCKGKGVLEHPQVEIAPDKYLRPNIRQSTTPSPNGCHWRPPKINNFKFNVDAAWSVDVLELRALFVIT
ncbi:hypothetical protein M9H77_13288 [Catharanthus roseus]|uniref:Uncharacterized protein n=1 Tax=Catharanthus roseus TaxID=4058 RepID=A0ACC0BK41_CATRO|nr:hypothetical protein M9H77_13288 [Catharanthus roseus]